MKMGAEWNDLSDKVVLVTGASSGLGRGFCVDLGKAGCRLVVAARRVDRLYSLCKEINGTAISSSSSSSSPSPASPQPRAVAVELDVCAEGAVIEKSIQKAWNAFGRIHVLINNAGIRGSVETPLKLSEEEWNVVMKTNLTGCWLVSKYVCMRMCKWKQGGSVINISSIAGLNRGLTPGAIAYSCSKAALDTMTKVMALELGAYNIRVNSISPGIFKSEITENLMRKKWLSDVASKVVPLKTLGTANPALTSLIRYLIHDSSCYVSGNTFVVDSGTTVVGLPIFSLL